jgi:hypothetical protein
MLKTIWENLGSALPVLNGEAWAIGPRGELQHWPKKSLAFLTIRKFEAKLANWKKDGPFEEANEGMREALAAEMAGIADAAGQAGDFRVFERRRGWHLQTNSWTLEAAVAMVTSHGGLEDPKKEFLYRPSSKRILSKMKNAELAARISDLVCVAETMRE